ncbi:MAG: hypothetical protein RLY16_1950 [Bacteroidota bacterium]
MLDNLIQLVKDQGLNSIINNPAVPNEKNNEVLADATHSVTDGLQGLLSGGGLQSLTALFSQGGDTGGLLQNPTVQNIVSNFTGKLTNQHGVAGDQASGIANSLIPNVLSNLIQKTNNPNDSSFDLNGIMQSLSGGSGFNLQGLVSKFAGGGLDTDGDGKVEVSDIVSKVTGGGNSGGGGLTDMLKGFMQ